MLPIPASPSYATWLLGQSVAVVVLVAWVISLLRQNRGLTQQLKLQSADNQRLQTRNEELSDSLVELVRSRSQELLDATESRMHNVLARLENALTTKRSG